MARTCQWALLLMVCTSVSACASVASVADDTGVGEAGPSDVGAALDAFAPWDAGIDAARHDGGAPGLDGSVVHEDVGAPESDGGMAGDAAGLPDDDAGSPENDAGSSDGSCTNLCTAVVDCGDGTPTTLTGTVYAPNGTLPLSGAWVYVPNETVPPFEPELTCSLCGDEPPGAPLAVVTSAPDGSFRLENVPAGVEIPLVVQIGRWRRQTMISSVPACVETSLGASQTRLPRSRAEGDVPRIAVTTGLHDAPECVLRKLGVDASEFTNSSGDGRVQLYRANGVFIDSEGSIGDPAPALFDDPARLAGYDQILMGCELNDHHAHHTSTQQSNLREYATRGGRLFMTHASFSWIFANDGWANAAPWYVQGVCVRGGSVTTSTCRVDADCFPAGSTSDFCYRPWPTKNASGPSGAQRALAAAVDTTSSRGLALSTWLGTSAVSIQASRHDVDDVVTALYGPAAPWPASYHSVRLIHSAATVDTSTTTDMPRGTVQALAFDTPWGQDPAGQCGRVVFSDFHVDGFLAASTSSCASDATCPVGHRCLTWDLDTGDRACIRSFADACMAGASLSEQERLLAFLIFDAVGCVGPS